MSKKVCSHCNKSLTISGKHKYCDPCEKEIKVVCKKEGCHYKRSLKHPYCGKHEICYFVDQTKELGKKVCYGHLRGCRVQLDVSYEKSSCEDCLKKLAVKDTEKRNHKKKECPKENEEGKKLCERCFGYFDKSEFIGNLNKEVIGCKKCREIDKENDKKRDKEHGKEMFQKRWENKEYREKYYARKKNWRESNYGKVVEYWKKSRAKKILERTEEEREEILKQNAEGMKQWRKENPEKVEKQRIWKVTDIKQNYNTYVRSATSKNLNFEFTLEEFEEFVKKECYYCSIIQEKGFNGIDRVNPNMSYTKENCKSCCKDCNMLKQSLSENVFLERIEHILSHQEIIEDNELHPEIFCDHRSKSFEGYKKSAEKRKKEFKLTEEEFNNIRKEECYLCRKENTESHLNGIDRVNNKEGYTIENCESCCGECNYLKRDFDINYLLLKLEKIYKNRKTEVGFIYKGIIILTELKSINKHLNKKTKEEKEKIKKEKKENKIEILKEKYPQFVKKEV